MGEIVLYIHGKGGSAAESRHYQALFPDCEVLGLDYRSSVPWEAGGEIRGVVNALRNRCGSITLIANSIGAYFSMCAGIDDAIRRAYFISPIVDMERLIVGMMRQANVSEAALRASGTIPTTFGEDLSWEYLSWVRAHPLRWATPTRILYGENDALTPREAVEAFARAHRAGLTVMPEGEHWFHTEEQMRFLDNWIMKDREGEET